MAHGTGAQACNARSKAQARALCPSVFLAPSPNQIPSNGHSGAKSRAVARGQSGPRSWCGSLPSAVVHRMGRRHGCNVPVCLDSFWRPHPNEPNFVRGRWKDARMMIGSCREVASMPGDFIVANRVGVRERRSLAAGKVITHPGIRAERAPPLRRLTQHRHAPRFRTPRIDTYLLPLDA